jgi:hypothetical protein
MSEPKYIRVTREEYYLVDMLDEKRTKINGWSMKEVIRDWFVARQLGASHATRDSYKIGGTERFLRAEVVSAEEFVKCMEEQQKKERKEREAEIKRLEKELGADLSKQGFVQCDKCGIVIHESNAHRMGKYTTYCDNCKEG